MSVVNGAARADACKLAEYLMQQGENEKVSIFDVKGGVSDNLFELAEEIDFYGTCSNTKKYLYHAQINPRAREQYTDEQITYAIDRLEKELGFQGQPRMAVVHEKQDRDGELRQHIHVGWLRVDRETGKALPIAHNYRRHEIVARDLERAFGHEYTQGVHVEREGVMRPTRRPKRWENEQQKQTGFKIDDVKRDLTEAWQRTDNGKNFKAEIERNGYILAAGDRRDFVVVDPMGGTHSLARRIDGAKAADVRARFSDLDRDQMPTVREAKDAQRERRLERQLNRIEDHERDLHPPTPGSNAGMAAQQREAVELMKSKHNRQGVHDRKQELTDAQRELQQRREALLREFGQDLDQELGPRDPRRR